MLASETGQEIMSNNEAEERKLKNYLAVRWVDDQLPDIPSMEAIRDEFGEDDEACRHASARAFTNKILLEGE